jgi:hypothetical protein
VDGECQDVAMHQLTQDSAYIFRITHRDNLPWLLSHGLHCRNSPSSDQNFREIGSKDLILKRASHPVPIDPGGTLSDYVPFYFTPLSIMLLNIKTGHNGIPQLPMEEIIILGSTLPKCAAEGVRFVFTDKHARLASAQFRSELCDLDMIDWKILQMRDFKHDPDDPDKKARYQAEALLYQFVPVSALMGIICHSEPTKARIDETLASTGNALKTFVKPEWYF